MYTLEQTHCWFLVPQPISSLKSTILQITSCTVAAINISHVCFILPLVFILGFSGILPHDVQTQSWPTYIPKKPTKQPTNHSSFTERIISFRCQGSAQTGAAATSMMGGASVSKIYHLPFLRWRWEGENFGRQNWPIICWNCPPKPPGFSFLTNYLWVGIGCWDVEIRKKIVEGFS